MKLNPQESMDKILNFINEYISENSVSPSLMEISGQTSISKSQVDRLLIRLEKEGLITGYTGNTRRGLKLAGPLERSKILHLPIVGKIACGTPILAEENIDGYVDISEDFLGMHGEFFALRTQGDSMINAGIEDGDIVIVRKQPDAEIGQVVVALIDEEATLKRYYKDPKNRTFILHPENDEMEDIIVDHMVIQGIAVKVIKDIL